MNIVAEGAELADQVTQLQSMGCKFGQGYYFSRPVDLDGAAALLESPGWKVSADQPPSSEQPLEGYLAES